MKLLENNSFEVLNSSLFMEVGDARIVVRYGVMMKKTHL